MYLVILLIGVLPLKHHRIWAADSAGDFTMSKYLGVICLMYALGYVFVRGRSPRLLNTQAVRWTTLLFSLAFISYVLTPLLGSGIYASRTAIMGVGSLSLLAVVLLCVVDSLKRLRIMLLATIGSVGWASLYVLHEWSGGGGWATGATGEWVVGDRNYFAVSITCAVSLSFCLMQTVKPGWERWLCRCCAALALGAVIIGGSRGGFLGLSAAVLFAAARSRRRFRKIAVILVLGIVFNLGYSRSPLRRLLSPDENDKGSEYAHSASWAAGLNMVRAHPVTGVGLGMFKSRMLEYAPAWYSGLPFMAHSAYVSVAAEMGIPGLLVFLAVIASTGVSLERVRRMRAAPRLLTQSALGLQAALVGCSVAVGFISGEYHSFLWLTISLSACVVRLARRCPIRSRAFAPECLPDLRTAAPQV